MNIPHPKSIQPETIAKEILTESPILYEKLKDQEFFETRESVEAVYVELVKFLYLIGYFKTRLTPSVAVDLAWHELILCTKFYFKFCDSHFGRYIHHHPGGKKSENRSQFIKTISSYQLCYGSPPEKYWGKLNLDDSLDAECGSCNS